MRKTAQDILSAPIDESVLEMLRRVLPHVPDDVLSESSWYLAAVNMTDGHEDNGLDVEHWLCNLRDSVRRTVEAGGEDGTREALQDDYADFIHAWDPWINRYFVADMCIGGIPGDPPPSLVVFFGAQMVEVIQALGEALGGLSHRLHEAGMDSIGGRDVQGR